MSGYTTYQGASYRPGEYGQYGMIPTDGRHKVALDATGSTGKGNLQCAWKIYSNPVVKTKADCARCGSRRKATANPRASSA